MRGRAGQALPLRKKKRCRRGAEAGKTKGKAASSRRTPKKHIHEQIVAQAPPLRKAGGGVTREQFREWQARLRFVGTDLLS